MERWLKMPNFKFIICQQLFTNSFSMGGNFREVMQNLAQWLDVLMQLLIQSSLQYQNMFHVVTEFRTVLYRRKRIGERQGMVSSDKIEEIEDSSASEEEDEDDEVPGLI